MNRLLSCIAAIQVLGCVVFFALHVPPLSGDSSRHGSSHDGTAVRRDPSLVVIGDLHGDLKAARRALRLAGVLDASTDRWLPGVDTVVVQVGDQIDRGADDREVLELFDRLASEAAEQGGACISIIGDHEILNCELAMKYVHPSAYAAFDGEAETEAGRAALAQMSPQVVAAKDRNLGEGVWRGRAAAFLPGGAARRLLARRSLAHRHGGTIVVHAGLVDALVARGSGAGAFTLASWADLEAHSEELRAWLEANATANAPAAPPAWADHHDGPLWTRRLGSADPAPADCEALRVLLRALGARRLVVGHTVQGAGRVTPACGGAAWRVDVGLGGAYPAGRKGKAEVLLVRSSDRGGDEIVSVLRTSGGSAGSANNSKRAAEEGQARRRGLLSVRNQLDVAGAPRSTSEESEEQSRRLACKWSPSKHRMDCGGGAAPLVQERPSPFATDKGAFFTTNTKNLKTPAGTAFTARPAPRGALGGGYLSSSDPLSSSLPPTPPSLSPVCHATFKAAQGGTLCQPRFAVIGSQEGGAGGIVELLAQHPQVKTPGEQHSAGVGSSRLSVFEPHYFMPDPSAVHFGDNVKVRPRCPLPPAPPVLATSRAGGSIGSDDNKWDAVAAEAEAAAAQRAAYLGELASSAAGVVPADADMYGLVTGDTSPTYLGW